ncbi:MAG: alpha/beta hydrolase [Pirellulales bacterium]|nr:alpha/beta hydrolase [Pirellulales bacterium]
MSDVSDTTELIFLPAFGTDARLYTPQANVFKNFTVPSWISHRRGESLSQYAERLAETINPRGPYIIGGVSLGGMVAHELAVHLCKRDLKPSGLILVATCRSRNGLRGWQRGLAPLANALPAEAYSIAKPLAPVVNLFYMGLPEDLRRLPVRMFQDQDSRFMQWALAAILRWQSSPPADVPTFQLHGRRDHVISIKNVEPNEIIEDGGHLINLSHAEQVNEFIARAVASVSS